MDLSTLPRRGSKRGFGNLKKDIKGPITWGRYGIVYRVPQPLLVSQKPPGEGPGALILVSELGSLIVSEVRWHCQGPEGQWFMVHMDPNM